MEGETGLLLRFDTPEEVHKVLEKVAEHDLLSTSQLYNVYRAEDGSEHQTIDAVRRVNEEYEQRFNVKIPERLPSETSFDKYSN